MATSIFSAALALALSIAGLYANPSEPSSIKTLRDRNIQLVEHSPGVSGVFEVLSTGEVRHLQSGVVCPASLPSLSFWHAEVFSSTDDLGDDVGCDYGRNATPGHWESKLTAFMIRAKGAALDDAFRHYRSEVEQTYPGAKYLGTVNMTSLGDRNATEALPVGELRSAEFELTINGVRHLSELIVAVRNGWVVEVRGTFRRETLCAESQACDGESVSNAKLDTASPPLLLQAVLKGLQRR